MARTKLLVYPEDVPECNLDGPQYAEVGSRGSSPTISISVYPGQGEPTKRATISRSLASQRAVASGESITDGPGLLLRRAGYGRHQGRFIYGQVTAYDDTSFTVTTAEGDTVLPIHDVSEVTPVVATLLGSATLIRSVSARPDLSEVHDTIMDRILGRNGHRASKSIRKILSGVAPVASMPKSTDVITWICPHTGRARQTRVGHVVDYAFYVDSGRPVPQGISMGNSFCDDPEFQGPLPVAHQRLVDELVDQVDDVEDHDDERFEDLMASLASDSEQAQIPRARIRESTTVATDDELMHPTTHAILHALAEKPQLLRVFVDQLERASKRQRLYVEDKRLRVIDSRLQLQLPVNNHRRHLLRNSSQYQICYPTADRAHGTVSDLNQETIHHAITSDAQKGKDPALFIVHARTSESTRFMPHPAILRRLYSFEFGPAQLSILHFVRFDLDAQFDMSEANNVNLSNFSEKVALPVTPKNPSRLQLVSAISALSVYGKEFLCSATQDLISAAHDFAESLVDYEPWAPIEIKVDAFWCSKIFGSFRRAVQFYVTHSASRRGEIR
ncbi:LOW QUALITY PROTEIN: hypothetical protein PHMEG_00033693, partial [Phytophthora megakarya]